jgi:Asp-tRNA(Asn)/Glu-tRNA(Gln) amidotransferase A subunit family amidase
VEAIEAARAVRERRVSPVELVEEALRAAEAWQPVTNAFSALHPDEALVEARRRADEVARAEVAGPLHGVPVAVKDLFDVAGWETTGCCAAYRGRVADRDAAVVRALREAGAVIIGKTNQHELAAGATNLVSACGPTANPWDPRRITGGSSGGSGAATATRVVPVALGSDTGGSVRIPAALCGVAGLKPTHGALSLDGVMPLAPSMDTVGVLGPSVLDLALAFAVLAGDELAEPRGPLPSIGVFEEPFVTEVHADVRRSVEAVAATFAGAAARVVRLPGGLSYDPEDWDRLGWSEFFEAHGHLVDGGDIASLTRRFLEKGRDLPPEERDAARRRTEQLREVFLGHLRSVDVLLAATTPAAAIAREDRYVVVEDGRSLDVIRGGVSLITRPANMVGLPALSLPAGFTEDGLPVGVQLIGRPGEEHVLLHAGAAFQEVTDHHRRQPALRSPPEERVGKA